MSETEDFTTRISELENRISYLEKKFNVNINSSEVLFPKTATVVDASVKTTNGEQ